MNQNPLLPSLAPRALVSPAEAMTGPRIVAIDPATKVGMGEYLALLWRKKFWILAAMLLGGAGEFIYVVYQPPVYRSAVTLELVGINESFLGMNQVDPSAGGGYSSTATNIQTQTRIIMSDALLRRAAERVSLEMTPIGSIPRDVFNRMRNWLHVLPQEPAELMKQAVLMAASSTVARGLGGSRLMEIDVESTSPEVSATYANTLANEYIAQSSQFRANTAIKTAQWMEGQLEETKNRLAQAEDKLQEFMKKSGNLFILDQSTLADSKLRQLQNDLSAGQADRIAKQSRWEIAKGSPVDSVPEILDDGRMKELGAKLTDLRRERAQLLATLVPTNPKVQRIDSQISEIDRTLKVEKVNLVKRIQNEYEAAVKREKLLQDAYNVQGRVLSGQAEQAGQYSMLKREAESTRQIYNTLLQQLNQASVVAAVPASNTRVIDPAAMAGAPISPKPARDIPQGVILSGGLVALSFIGFERWKGHKRSKVFAQPGLVGFALNVPELGVIPSLATADERTSEYSILPAVRQAFSPADPVPGRRRRGELLSWQERPSFLADSFRYTLASIFSRSNRRSHAAFLVTSACPGDGKTTIVANLAVATAEIGRRVVVVDFDLRQPRLHRSFDQPISPGCRDLVLSGGHLDSVDLSPFLRTTEIPGLFLMPAGEAGDERLVGSLMFSDRLDQLFARLKADFDVVLVDTAPVLQLPDARLLARFMDGVILVVRSGVTYRESVVAALQRFQDDGIPILGTVLNDWVPLENDVYGHYRYGYGGGYGVPASKKKLQ